MSGSGISWAICKSALRSRQITTPVPHHSVFYRPDALPAAQPTASKHWRHTGGVNAVNIVCHCALKKAQFESLEAVQKRTIHITHDLTCGMPYSSMLLYVNLDSLAAGKEDLFFCDIMDPAPLLWLLGSDLLIFFLKFILVPSTIVLLYNMVLTTTHKHTFFPWSFDYLSYYQLFYMITWWCM